MLEERHVMQSFLRFKKSLVSTELLKYSFLMTGYKLPIFLLFLCQDTLLKHYSKWTSDKKWSRQIRKEACVGDDLWSHFYFILGHNKILIRK